MTKIIVGMGFMGLGVVGLFLPILQGVLFMLVGLAILSTESSRVRRFRDEIKRRYPGPWRQAQALKDRMKARFGIADPNDKETAGDEGASGSAS